jgi:hypothetical protein
LPRRGELPAQNEKKTKLKTAIQFAGFARTFKLSSENQAGWLQTAGLVLLEVQFFCLEKNDFVKS